MTKKKIVDEKTLVFLMLCGVQTFLALINKAFPSSI